MHFRPALALPIAVTFASLVAGALAAPPTHLGQVSAAAESATGIDGGGAVDLTMPWDQQVAPANSTALGPPGVTPTSVLGADSPSPTQATQVTVDPALVVTGSTSGIPSNVLVAYQHAAQAIATTDPGCHLPWPVLAGIGKVESGHARGGALDSNGRTLSPILGPVLSGGSWAAIRDTDDGRWDGDRVWDRAVGPMQFIPSSWRAHAVDGNGDGVADPSNIYDATLAAAGYLCTGDRDLSRTSDLRQAVFGYNHSSAYVDTVLAWARAYSSGGALAIAPVSGGGGVVLASAGGSNNGSPSGHHSQHPRATPTPTPTPRVTLTPTPTASATTSSPATSAPATETPTSTATPSPTGTPTETGCPTPTPTPTGSETPTGSPSPTPTPTPTPPQTPPDDPTATPSPTPTDPCATPSPTPTATSTELPSPTPTP
jgi:membrane-bound lytic murein transglycosylase B